MPYTITEIPNLYKSEKVLKLTKKEKKYIQDGLYEISMVYHDSIPVGKIENILNGLGFHLIQEDGTPFSGFFCGREGSCYLQFADEDNNTPKCVIALQWYRIGDAILYEINCYLS